MTRILSGVLKGFPVTVPRHIRATEAKVRQALFNILGSTVVGARVLDGFAGSGALGLEALSRGAASVLFVDSHPACVAAIRSNCARIASRRVPGTWEVWRMDILRAIRRLRESGRRFDLILFDPPYASPLGKKALKVVADCAILAPAGFLCLEHEARDSDALATEALRLQMRHRYGETVLSFYQLVEP